MKINDIFESTTSGSIAPSVATVGKMHSRNLGIYPGKAGSMFQGKNTKAKFPNSISEDELAEQDLIVVPGQGRKAKSGFIPHGRSRIDHEVEMARSDLFSAAKNAKQVYEMIQSVSEDEGLEGWVQEKIIKANDYLNTIREYLEGKQIQQESVVEGVRVDSLVTDALKIMRGAELTDAVKALKTVLGDREYNSRRGFYNFYIKQMIDMYNKQGVAEGSGGNWYIRVNGKILNDTKFKPVIFSSEDEARSHAMKLADKKRIPLSQIKLTKSWMDAPEQGVAEGEGNKYGSQENWDSLRKDIRSQYPYKKGTNVTVPHKGKLVNGKIVRYEAGKGGYSPTYVVDIGEYESIMVPPNKVRRDATESLGTTGAMTNGEMGEGKRNLKCVCKTHGTLQCPVHTPKDIDVLEGAKVDRMVKHVAKSEKKLGHSKKEAENIAWATANKRGMLDNKNKKA